jgi:glyoxylase-like metal-dependent hydrolase (beta-lactamase superfamily II)
MATQLFNVNGLCVDVSYLVMGPLENNVYIIGDGEGVFVVDPSTDASKIVAALDGRKLDAIVLTHSHWDHVGAAAELRALTGAPVIASVGDADAVESPSSDGTSRTALACTVDRRVKTGDLIHVGSMEWKVIETPGHTPGSMCLFCIPQNGNHPGGLPVLVSGDTLFAGATGRTDFEGGSDADMAKSMKKLAKLPDDVAVLPGHNSLTTIGNSRRVFAMFGDEPE